MTYGMKDTWTKARRLLRMWQAKPCMTWSQFKQNVMKKIKSISIIMLDRSSQVESNSMTFPGLEKENEIP